MRRVFWASFSLLAWTYVGFPVVVLIRARLAPRPYSRANISPPVSVLIAVHNEVQMILERLENLASLEYPSGQIEIIVASDGSDDGTDEVVELRAAVDPRVRLLSLPRSGKNSVLNAAAAAAAGEILIFSDANTTFATDAMQALLRPFADPSVGCVAGRQKYTHHGEAPGERAYWNLDQLLKIAETAAGSAVSATGAIYAVRSHLYAPIPDGVTDDFAISTSVILQGYRLVFAPDAIAYERVAPSLAEEYARKVRVATGGLLAVGLRRALLNPFRFKFYAVEVLSHKVLRRLMAPPLLGLLVGSVALRRRSVVYSTAANVQTTFYALAIAGSIAARTRLGRLPILSLPAYFCVANIATLHALANILRGRRIGRWTPVRELVE